MKEYLENLLNQAVQSLQASGELPEELVVNGKVSRTRDSSHGDYAANTAMALAKPARRNPRELAQQLIDHLPASEKIGKVEIAGPGFINFYLTGDQLSNVVSTILTEGERYGHSDVGRGIRVQVEFVSANPTGPLHIGHGRGAAIGATISNLLAATGHDVQREYYVNDAGRQMDILATSVWLRYLEINGESLSFPSNGYKGEYIFDISRQLADKVGVSLVHPAATVLADVPADEPAGGDKEAHIDGLIGRSRQLLGEAAYQQVFDLALNDILGDIRADLAEFGVVYDNFFSERSLQPGLPEVIEKLKSSGYLYENNGAWWLKSTEFGDEKDRVVIRDNGQPTYLASDIAYIVNKLERGFDHILYVFGADHHGYVKRLLAVCQALGYDPERLEFLLIQFANLFSDGQRQQMSTRSGEFVTIRQLREDVGKDAARYFYVMRRYQQHLEFDLDLARSQTRDNPVYYVQYAHARICSVERQLIDSGKTHDQAEGLANLSLLTQPHETELMTQLSSFPEVVRRAAQLREPHLVTTGLQELANGLNKYYEAHKWLVEDAALRNARLCLIFAARQVIANGLHLLDVSAPEVL